MPQSDLTEYFSFKRVVTNVLGRLLRGGKAKAVKTARCRTRKAQTPKAGNPETRVVPFRRRVLVQDGVHNMFPPASDEESNDDDMEEMKEMMNTANDEEMEEIKDEELGVIKDICKATSMNRVQQILDKRVKDDWLGGLDSLPGNIYMISALNWRHLDKSLRKGMAKRLGMVAVLWIQFLGPPVIFWQSWYGFGVDDHEQIHWSSWSLSLSDWAPEEQYFLTKFLALLFLFCFILNGLFSHFDETRSWLKVCKIVNLLNRNGEMEDVCMYFLYLGAFMNTWVIFWLCIDVWLIVGVSDSVLSVLMDAMGLAFLYNLDDIGSDLRFVDGDDWPGLQLAWVDSNMRDIVIQYEDIETEGTDPPAVCVIYLKLCAGILGIFSFVLPVLFILTPFNTMKHDPFFESITESMWVNATVRTVSV